MYKNDDFKTIIYHDMVITVLRDKKKMAGKCNGNAQRLCSLENCKKCFSKSFASHPKSKFWHSDNEIDPRYVFLSTCKKYRFICDKCEHIFESALSKVSNKKDPRWCPYCSNQKLCDDEE